MFIVLEGTDASGKSSIAAAVKEQLRAQSPASRIHEFHKGRPEALTRRWVLHEYAVDIESTDWTKELAVADRWHWGECTYAKLKRPQTNTDGYGLLGIAGWRWVELFMASRGMAQFWVYQPLDVIKKRILSRGDDFVDAEEMEEILSLYESTQAKTHSIQAKIEVPDGEKYVKSVASAIITAAAERADEVARITAFPEYIGPARPRVLLIGDKRKDPTETILPFMPVGGNSGDYLLNALPEPLWRDVGIINSEDFSGERLDLLLEALNWPKIIVLGRLADRHVRTKALCTQEYVVLPHPQYVRRFHHADKKLYGEAMQSYAYGTDERYVNWILP